MSKIGYGWLLLSMWENLPLAYSWVLVGILMPLTYQYPTLWSRKLREALPVHGKVVGPMPEAYQHQQAQAQDCLSSFSESQAFSPGIHA